jgi:hypothetical protein
LSLSKSFQQRLPEAAPDRKARKHRALASPMLSSLLSSFVVVFAGPNYTEELWRACAGPLVSIPKVGERVWYFPQGHMEQVRDLPRSDLRAFHLLGLGLGLGLGLRSEQIPVKKRSEIPFSRVFRSASGAC